MTPKFQGLPRMAVGQVGSYGCEGGREPQASWDTGGRGLGGSGAGLTLAPRVQ